MTITELFVKYNVTEEDKEKVKANIQCILLGHDFGPNKDRISCARCGFPRP